MPKPHPRPNLFRSPAARRSLRLALGFLAWGILAGNPAAAGDCREVRVDQANGSMARIPVMHQDGTETCYAYTAAQLADALRHRTIRGLLAKGAITEEVAELHFNHLTSPLVVAVNTAAATGRDTVNLGHLTEALATIFRTASCSHRVLGDRFGYYDLNGFLGELKMYYDGMRARRPGQPIAPPPSALDCCTDARDPGDPLSRRSLEKYLRANSFVGFLKETFDGACRRNSLAVPSAKINAFHGFREAYPVVRQQRYRAQLNLLQMPDDLPIAINFCADILRNRQVTGVGNDGNPARCRMHHSALVVGRRPGPDGTCEYLVRNSLGDSDIGYAWESERGQIWVEERALLRNVTATVGLE